MHFCRTAQSALLQYLSKYQIFDIRRNFSWIEWFSLYNTKFEVSEPFSPNFNPFGRIWKFFHFCKTAKSALLQDLSKFQTFDIRRNVSFTTTLQLQLLLQLQLQLRFTTLNLEYQHHFYQVLIHLAGFENVFIFAKQLSQLCCRIHRNFHTFDTVDHTTLCDKLKAYDLCWTINDLYCFNILFVCCTRYWICIKYIYFSIFYGNLICWICSWIIF